MEFGFSEEQKILIDSLTRFCKKEIEPLVDDYDKNKRLSDPAILKGLLKKLQPFGFLSGPVPEKYGGMDLDFLTTGLIEETLAKYFSSLAGICLIQMGAARLLATCSNEALKEKYVPALCRGDKIACICVTEPNVGSNPAFIETTLTKVPGGYRLNGTKTWISNGSVSDIAIVIASVDRKLGAKGLTAFLVDREETPYPARDLDKLGLRSFPTSELHFEDILVPEENQVVETGRGLATTLKTFEMARALMAATSVGLARAAIEVASEYAKQREQSGRVIASFQLVQDMLADMLARTEASAFLTYRAFWLMDQDIRCDAQSAMAKFYATEAAAQTTSEAIQVLGGYGLSEEYPAERLFRDARSMTIPDGTTQIQKLIVARDLLGVSAFF